MAITLPARALVLLTLSLALASAQDTDLIANGSFEDHGELQDKPLCRMALGNSIDPWSAQPPVGIGLNTPDVRAFFETGTVPDGETVLWLQNTASVRQTVYDLLPGQGYRLELRANGRRSDAPDWGRIEILVNGRSVYGPEPVSAVEDDADFHRLSAGFRARSGYADIEIRQAGPPDGRSLLIDHVRLIPTQGPVTEREQLLGPNPARPWIAPLEHLSLDGADWVWHPGDTNPMQAAVGRCYFRREYAWDSTAPVQEARVVVAVDNLCDVYCNGAYAGTAEGFAPAWIIDLTPHWRTGINTLAVMAENEGDTPNPAGLALRLVVAAAGSRLEQDLGPDTWHCARDAADGWTEAGFDTAQWLRPRAVGPVGMAPWGNPAPNAAVDGIPLPAFTSSASEHDDLLQDLFQRHLRAEFDSRSLRKSDWPLLPGGITLWMDWNVSTNCWFDVGPANCPLDNRPQKLLNAIRLNPVDRFGYRFCAMDHPVPPTVGPLTFFGMGWPFPDYAQSMGHSVGYEWNGDNTLGWSPVNAETRTVSGGTWTCESTAPDPALLSPAIRVDWFHAPFVHMDIQYETLEDSALPESRAFRLSWTTESEPEFSAGKSVLSRDFPAVPVDRIDTGPVRRVWFPMYLHPGWRDQTITGLRLEPVLPEHQTRRVVWKLNCLRLDYDTRQAVNNPNFIRGVARKFFWDGDRDLLAEQLPRLRKAMQFLLTHLQAERLNLLDSSWLVGHDGLGRLPDGSPNVGHGIGNNYFDIAAMGPREIQSSVLYYLALQDMARIEAYVQAHPELDSPRPSVDGPDGHTPVPYLETAASLHDRVARTREAIHREFWNPDTGRYAGWRDANGELHDYGYAHFNVEALEAGIPPETAARQILAWLNGERLVAGDTSTGDDIYAWRFAVRMSTLRNLDGYVWGWDARAFPFGDQVQDGGAVMWSTYYDVKGRLRYGDVEGAWEVWQRMLDHHSDVREFGGKGYRFYRDYYRVHPGTLQGGGPPGGLGLDAEFIENLLTPCTWPLGWMGIDATAPYRLRIAPTFPPGITRMGVTNVTFAGNRLDILCTPDAIDLSGSDLSGSAAELELVFPPNPEHPSPAPVLCPLEAIRFEIVTGR